MGNEPTPAPPTQDEAGDRGSRITLIWLTACAVPGIIYFGLNSACSVQFIHVSNWILGVSFIAAVYCAILAVRAFWLSGRQLYRAWRNLFLLVIFCFVGITVVGFTYKQHRNFWEKNFPSLARDWRA